MMQVESFDNEHELLHEVASRLMALIESRAQQPFRLALTGGTLGIGLLERMHQLGVDPSGVEVYWGDERWVSLDHPDRNEFQALSAWPSLSNANLHRFGSPVTQNLETAASEMNVQYEDLLGKNVGFGFDLVLLGVGPDGHVASLFPGHTRNQNPWVIFETDSPKPPPERLSFSYAALNASKQVWFLAAGETKAPVVTEAILGDANSNLPCSQVRGIEGTIWFVDAAIAKSIAAASRD